MPAELGACLFKYTFLLKPLLLVAQLLRDHGTGRESDVSKINFDVHNSIPNMTFLSSLTLCLIKL